MNGDQYVGIVHLGEVRPRIQLERRRVGAGEEDGRPRAFEQALRLERHRKCGDRLPEPRRPRGAERRMSRVEHDGATPQRVVRCDLGRTADLEQQVAAVIAGAVSPDATREVDRDGHFVRGRLGVAHTPDQRVSAAVLHPIDV